jgi:hypothetical protein
MTLSHAVLPPSVLWSGQLDVSKRDNYTMASDQSGLLPEPALSSDSAYRGTMGPNTTATMSWILQAFC